MIHGSQVIRDGSWARGVCSDNGDVLPEAAIPADRAKDISGRTGPIGYLDNSVTRRPGKDVCQKS